MKRSGKRGRELDGRLLLYCLPIVHRVPASLLYSRFEAHRKYIDKYTFAGKFHFVYLVVK